MRASTCLNLHGHGNRQDKTTGSRLACGVREGRGCRERGEGEGGGSGTSWVGCALSSQVSQMQNLMDARDSYETPDDLFSAVILFKCCESISTSRDKT